MDSSIFQLLYMSQAREPLTKDDISAILASSRKHNAANGITGLLIYRHGKFLQLLEGPQRAIAATYERIKLDPRHTHIITQCATDVDRRLFSTWSMAFGTELITEAEDPAVFLDLDKAMQEVQLAQKVILSILEFFAKNA